MPAAGRIGIASLLLLASLMAPPSAIGETIAIPLSFATATGSAGDYLSSPFDFGSSFSRIESLRLELLMPSGYEGTAVSTGNSSYDRHLIAVIQETATPLTVESINGQSEDQIRSSAFSILPAIPYSMNFSGTSFSFVDGVLIIHEAWPEFVLRGTGQVALIDEFDSSYHPLPAGVSLSSTTSWLPPDGIAQATLIVVGTPVPEPKVSALLLACLAWTGKRFRCMCLRK
jgi:hypothetical protein